MFKNYLQIVLIALPAAILLGGGVYLAYDTWKKYSQTSSLKIQLNNVELLQSLEYSVLNEIVCVATMSQNANFMKKVCTPTEKTTDSVIDEILTQQEDTSLHALKQVVATMRSKIKNSANIAVEKLVNGDLDREISTLIEKYKIKFKDNNILHEEKEFIRLFFDISDISRATASEKALVSYYLSLQKSIPNKNLIYWDERVSHADVLESKSENVPYLNDYIKDEAFQSLLRSIEDVRIDVMSNASSGLYRYDVSTWVGLINKKQKVLNTIETKILDYIYGVVDRNNKNTSLLLLLSIASLMLALLGLWLLYSLWKNLNIKNNFLSGLLTKVSTLSGDGEMKNLSVNNKNQKVAYAYISSSFETLYDKESKSNHDNKSNRLFLDNMSYEISSPLDAISGYTKLLKETPLNAEQNDYLEVIEDSFENLDAALKKIINDDTMEVQKLVIENHSFDMIRKVEFVTEAYVMKADKEDIVLGLYLDPMLSDKVSGDGAKLSQVLTSLVDNALESSKAYDSVNIFVEKLHGDNELVTIKFSIQDQGLGYTEDELVEINKALKNTYSTESIPNFDTKNLSKSNKIIKRMGGKLELTSKKGEGSTFYFVLSFEKDTSENTELLPTFDGMRVGLALPIRDIERQVDHNLEAYIKYLGARFEIYYYDTLFSEENDIELPELMFFYHNYARLEGELEQFSKLSCSTVMISSGALRARINADKYNFSSIVYGPISMRKIIRTFADSKLDMPLLVQNDTSTTSTTTDTTDIIDTKEDIETSTEFENIHALVVLDNEISQKIIVDILNNLSIDVTVATECEKAFSLRQEEDFDIIFMDMDMSAMKGHECTSKILYYEGINQLKHVPIVALDKNEENNDDITNKKLGIDDFISKPFESDKIYAIIKEYCVDIPMKMRAQEEDDFIAKVLSGDFLKEDG